MFILLAFNGVKVVLQEETAEFKMKIWTQEFRPL